MDTENWQALGIPEDFARNQNRVLDAFARMGVITTCSCTPYLFGNTPHFGEHIAWAESSAVCYANSVLGARTNREGGPSALAASLTGFTPVYGMHLNENRRPTLTVHVEAEIIENHHFGALGKCIGEHPGRTGRGDKERRKKNNHSAYQKNEHGSGTDRLRVYMRKGPDHFIALGNLTSAMQNSRT